MRKRITPPIVLTIAGTDPSGGAGIQADIKAISATGSFAASVITALVAQNTQGVQSILEIPSEFIVAQTSAVFTDMAVNAVKIGMLHDAKTIQIVTTCLEKWRPKPIVFDPVMVAKDGSKLLDESALNLLKKKLLPLIDLLTPNRYEAEILIGKSILTETDRIEALYELATLTDASILLKGGHFDHESVSKDYLLSFPEKEIMTFDAPRIVTNNTHGTGCTLSSAIASYLAQGRTLKAAISHAKNYLTNALEAATDYHIGHGKGPVDHFYFLER